MKCPFLTGERIKQCSAVTCTVVLSGCELSEYCESASYTKCPVYQAFLRKEFGLSLNEYCEIHSLWTKKINYSDYEKGAA